MRRHAFITSIAINALLPALCAAGCGDWLTGAKLSDDPGRAMTATRDQLFIGVQARQFDVIDQFVGPDFPFAYALTTTLWVQQMTGTNQVYSRDRYDFDEFDFGWRGIYGGGGLLDLRKIEASAREAHDRLYLGTAQVWEALLIGAAADFFGDVPYSEAAGGIPAPKLDSQAEVYGALQLLLDSAMVNLASDAGPGPGARDLVYGGEPAAWVEAAHTLKARLYLHTTERDPSAYTRALAEAKQGISTPDNDFATFQSARPGEENPWSGKRHGSGAAFSDTHSASAFFIDLLKSRNDPRLPIYFAVAGNGEFLGAGPGQEFDAQTMSQLSDTRGAKDFRQPIITWAENQLIKAETLYRIGDEAAARAELDAERRSVGLPDIAASGPALLTQILEEKYVALFQNVEAYNDYKRTCYPNLTATSDNFGGNIPARPFYPFDERNANPHIPEPSLQPTRNWNDPVTPFAPDGSPCHGQR
jgi:starch-binding outer membrane protein, SusD/RagB family